MCLSRKKRIALQASELGLTVEQDVPTFLRQCIVTTDSITALESRADSLEKLRAERVALVSQMAVEITHLWDLLGVEEQVRQRFLSKHLTRGADVIVSCRSEIEKLVVPRDVELDSLIVPQRQEVLDLWESLNVPENERRKIEHNESVTVEFGELENEVPRLKKFHNGIRRLFLLSSGGHHSTIEGQSVILNDRMSCSHLREGRRSSHNTPGHSVIEWRTI